MQNSALNLLDKNTKFSTAQLWYVGGSRHSSVRLEYQQTDHETAYKNRRQKDDEVFIITLSNITETEYVVLVAFASQLFYTKLTIVSRVEVDLLYCSGWITTACR